MQQIFSCVVISIFCVTASFADTTSFQHALKYRVDEKTIVLTNGDEADLYAPAINPSIFVNQAVDLFPVVIVLQGANVDKANYSQLGRTLAQMGLVVVIPNHYQSVINPATGTTVDGLFTDATVITSAFERITSEDYNPQSRLYRMIDTDHLGIVGHSYGGMVGLYATMATCLPPMCSGYERPSALRGAVFYGTHLVNYDGSVTDLAIEVPVMLLSGTLDSAATPLEVQQTLMTIDTPHALISITGANHYGLCDENNPFGALPDPTEPTRRQAESIFEIAGWIAHWLQVY
jgi:dienelactone hydrolase